MKMIRAVVRPEREQDVLGRLEAAGLYAMTKVPVLGRGQQRGVQVGEVSYDELAKLMLLVVVEEQQVQTAVAAIELGAHTGYPGDGKIFIQEVSAVFTVRSGGEGL